MSALARRDGPLRPRRRPCDAAFGCATLSCITLRRATLRCALALCRAVALCLAVALGTTPQPALAAIGTRTGTTTPLSPATLDRSALTLSLSTLPFGVVEMRYERSIDVSAWWAVLVGAGIGLPPSSLTFLAPVPPSRTVQEVAAQFGLRIAGDPRDSLSLGVELLGMRIGPRTGRPLDLGLAGGPMLGWMAQSSGGLTGLVQVVGGAVVRRASISTGDTSTVWALHGLVRVAVGYAW